MNKAEALEKVKSLWKQQDIEIIKRRQQLKTEGISAFGLDGSDWHKDISDKYRRKINDIILQIND